MCSKKRLERLGPRGISHPYFPGKSELNLSFYRTHLLGIWRNQPLEVTGAAEQQQHQPEQEHQQMETQVNPQQGQQQVAAWSHC